MLVAGAVAVPAVFCLAIRLRPVAGWFTRTDAARLAIAVSALVVWLEPIRSTLGFGQVYVILAALIPSTSRCPTARGSRAWRSVSRLASS
jgi:hypothetical protein